MKTSKSIKIFKHGSYVVLLLIMYVLQSTPRLFEINEIKPVLLICCACAIAVFEGEFVGGIYGAFAGLLLDTAGFSLFGFAGITLCIACVLIGLSIENFMQENIITYMLYVLIATFGIYAIRFVFDYGIWRLPSMERLFYKKVGIVSLYTALVSPVFYYLFKALYRAFRKSLERFTRN